jgi:hypothetical protein
MVYLTRSTDTSQRDEGNRPFDAKETRMLNFLYSEWTHPFFISITDYKRLMLGTGLADIITDDWTPQTIARYVWVELLKRAVCLFIMSYHDFPNLVFLPRKYIQLVFFSNTLWSI